MKPVLRLVTRSPMPQMLWVGAAVVALVLLVLTVDGLGWVRSPDFDDVQNSRFAEALDGQPPLPAVRAAAEGAGPEFATAVREGLRRYANDLRQSPNSEHVFATIGAEGVAAEEWNDTYVCGLQGWGEHRPVMRKLVLEGLGECGTLARFAARSPRIFDYGGFTGWLLALLPPILLLVFGAGAVALMLLRRAYRWLYESKMVAR